MTALKLRFQCRRYCILMHVLARLAMDTRIMCVYMFMFFKIKLIFFQVAHLLLRT